VNHNPPARCKKFLEEFVRTDEGIDFEDQYTYKDQLVRHLILSPPPTYNTLIGRLSSTAVTVPPPFSHQLYR